MGEDSKPPTINFPVKLRDLLVGAVALGAGTAGWAGFDQLKGNEAQGAMAQSQRTVDPAFKRDVDRQLQRIDGELKSQGEDIEAIEDGLDQIKTTQRQMLCHITKNQADGCLKMPVDRAR